MPPKDAFWYHLAYTVAGVVYTSYAIGLWWRRRKWRRKE
jgi:hypothetical protein